MLTPDECLAYIEQAVRDPTLVLPWHAWVNAHVSSLDAAFDRRSFLDLRYRGLRGAHSVLVRYGRIQPGEVEYDPLNFKLTHCDLCGARLLWALPGQMTRAEIVAYAQAIGDGQLEAQPWIHPGVYCPNKCITRLFQCG